MALRAALAALLATTAALTEAPAVASAEPVGFEHLYTYAELTASTEQLAADHPDIVSVFSIGRSYEGRELWAVKISDNAALDEDEPEVTIVGQIHAREWISGAMALYVLEALTSGYGSDERVTAIVDSREIFVVPMLNPDGAEYDIAAGTFRKWRKNRQPIPGSSAMGIDLNRNFGFKWRCCGGGSDRPFNERYRGWQSWVAPEANAYRQFVDSRVIGGRQQIIASLTFHSAGEMVLWPYAYTRAALPRTMSADDYAAFVALGRQMAALNGYRPMQGSRLYVADGDHDDWMYYRHRIFALTFELAAGKSRRYYLTADETAAETARNREAVLHFLEQANCPHRAAGLAATHCGPLNDDFEAARGWTLDPFGSDSATRGRFQRAVPQRTRTRLGVKQPRAVPSGQAALVSGARRGRRANANDVDGGVTSALSPAFTLGSGDGWTLSFRYTFAHDALARSHDYLSVSVVEGPTITPLFTELGTPANRNARWQSAALALDAFAGKTIQLFVEVADNGGDGLIEAALDDVRVYLAP